VTSDNPPSAPHWRPDQLLGARYDTPDLTGRVIGYEPLARALPGGRRSSRRTVSKKNPLVVFDIRVKIVLPADVAAGLLGEYLGDDAPGKHEKPECGTNN
jgi:hypothetical protein